ncbi:hypothetical protein GOEFS_004_00100 [Gordonia effusa NBRC 100432]|uniref:YdbS-like PH domain-containing protein n=1 Tax=Gordonia effusa NBRC 100432 TaxID=1077974 RepID=H0QUJ4_9ACTN|nr:PH domain-containing protein [Gordonia effusa]GAB16495.1 hypothetical protein GOEFS_004_00100 [Gordonia effusa NBRC 100432]
MTNSEHPSLRDPAYLVDPRARTLWRIGPLVFGVPVFLALLAVAVFVEPARIPTAIATLVVGAGTVFYTTVVPAWRYRFHRWEVTGTVIYSQAGWFTRTRVIIPISRVQVIDTAAGPFEQLLGLAQLKVTTASSAGTVHIAGLDAAMARQIASDLTIRIENRGDDAT